MSSTSAGHRIFLSYARRDGEDFATALRLRLEREHPELPVWQDRSRLLGGVGWWAQIEAAMEQVDYLVAVMTPDALFSEFTALEWRRARQEGVCIVPVLGVPAARLDWSSMPPWRRKVHFLDLEKEWPTFIAQLRSPCVAARTPFMAPDLPLAHVQRPREMEAAVQALLRARLGHGEAGTPAFTALQGGGGFGKTTLAAAVCSDSRVVDAFDDGILWITLGQTPNLQQELGKLHAVLTGERPAFVDVDDAVLSLARKLEARDCLLVVDDVWRTAHLRPVLRAAGRCRVLVTTRQLDVAAHARRIEIDEMTGDEAVQVLARGLDDVGSHLSALSRLARRLGEWPLLLQLCGGVLRQRVQRGDTLSGALAYVDKAYARRGPRAFDAGSAIGRDEAVAATIDMSLNALDPADRQRCAELSVFPEDVSAPLDVVAGFFGLDELDTEELAWRLSNGALVTYNPALRTLGMHDMTRAYLASLVPDGLALHDRLLHSVGDPFNLRSDYGWRWLSHHLKSAGRDEELQALLLDPGWLRAKLDATDVGALVADCEQVASAPAMQTLQSALRLAAPVLARAKDQLRTQLLARLGDTGNDAVARLRAALACLAGGPWLRPASSTLHSAHGVLECVIESDIRPPPRESLDTRLALSADGRWVLGVLPGGPVVRWDVQRRIVRALDAPAVAAVLLDGQPGSLIVGLSDGRVQEYDLERLAPVREWRAHAEGIRALACDATQAVLASVSTDEVRTWDLVSGRLLHAQAATIEVSVIDCALGAGGDAVVVATEHELLVLAMARPAESCRIDCRELGLQPAGLSRDGRLLLTRLPLGGLRVWHVDTLTPLRHGPVLAGQLAQFTAGNGALVVALGREVLVHDLASGQTQALRGGHGFPIEALACSDRDGPIVSLEPGRLLVWAGSAGRHKAATPQGHAGSVYSVAVSANAEWLATSAEDGVRRWRLRGHALQPAGMVTLGDRLVRFIAPDGRWMLAMDNRGQLLALDAGNGDDWPLPDVDGAAPGFARSSADRVDRRWLVLTPVAMPFPEGEPARLDEWMRHDHVVSLLWDTATGRMHRFDDVVDFDAYVVNERSRELLAWTSGRWLAWNLDTGCCESRAFPLGVATSKAQLSADGRWLLGWQPGGACVIAETSNGTVRTICQGGAAECWALSDDGAYAACWEVELTVWDIGGARPCARFVGDAEVTACCFLPGEHALVVAEAVGHVHVLEICE